MATTERLGLLWLLLLSMAVAASSSNASFDLSAAWAACLHVNTVGDTCDVASVCARCLRTSGCAFDVLERECVVLPDNGTALYASSSNALLNRTNLHYCADRDPLCAACSVSPSRPFYEGAGACVCLSLCSLQRTSQIACYAQRPTNMMYLSVAILAIAVTLAVVLHRLFTRGHAFHNLHANQQPRPRSGLALELASWRRHLDQHSIVVSKVAPLERCYVLMENRPTNSEPASPSAA